MNSFRKLLAISVSGVVISAVLFIFLVQPNLNKVSSLYKEASDKQTLHQALLDQILAYKSSQTELATVSNKDFVLNSVLERLDLEVVIEELENGAIKSGVTETLSIRDELDGKGKPKPTKPIVTGNTSTDDVYYNVTVNGPFISIVTFVQYLEHLPHFTEILKINLIASKSNAGDNLVINDEVMKGELEGIFMVRKVK